MNLSQEEVDEQKKLYDNWLSTVRNGKEYTAFGIWLACAKANKNIEKTLDSHLLHLQLHQELHAEIVKTNCGLANVINKKWWEFWK